MSECYVGLMSGTSIDAIDAAVVDFEPFPPRCIATASLSIDSDLRRRILALCAAGENEIERMGQLDVELGQLFARAAIEVMEKAGLRVDEVAAIGSHGQTIRHEPGSRYPFTLQIGDPNIIAQQTGITTVADFRRRDLAVGGQGAPLAPAYHRWFLRNRGGAVVNIGGMANVTLLPASMEEKVVGFDTGPGNVLIDGWMAHCRGERMDCDGAFARSGVVSEELLSTMQQEPFFQQSPPKSTGRERFNMRWLDAHLSAVERPPQDVAATLVELTATTIAESVALQPVGEHAHWICGGGAHNGYLLERIAAQLPGWQVDSSEAVGMDPDWVEAMAFAWLARQTLSGKEGNLPSVTGAQEAAILGAVFPVKSTFLPI